MNSSRSEAASYLDTYGVQSPTSVLFNRLCSYAHYFTLHSSLRPFGCNAMVGGYDAETQQYGLYSMEGAVGVGSKQWGAASGKGRQGGKTELEKIISESYKARAASGAGSADGEVFGIAQITVAEGLVRLVKAIKELRDEAKDKPYVLEASWVCEKSGRLHVHVDDKTVGEAREEAERRTAAEAPADDDENPNMVA